MPDPAIGYRRLIPIPAVLSGLCAAGLLPIGLFGSVTGALYGALLWAHLGLLGLAAAAAGLCFLDCAWRSRFPRPVALLLCVLFAAVTAALGSLPVTDPRALSTDLFVAAQWAASGSITEIKWHDPSYTPNLLAPVWTGLLQSGWIKYAAPYHGLYLIVLGGLICAYVFRRTGSADAALAGFFITLTMPVCIRFAAAPAGELASALFTAIACISLTAWFEKDGRWIDLLLAGLALGLAGSIGYRGLLVVFLVLALMLLLARSAGASPEAALGALLFCALLSFPLYALWLIRNACWTINPVYPLAKHLFSAVDGAARFQALTLRPFPEQLIQYPGGWREAALIPWRMIMSGRDGSRLAFDGVLSPILLLGLFPMVRLRHEPWLRFFFSFLVCYFVCIICAAPPTIPLFSPVFGLAAILCACGVHQVAVLFPKAQQPWLTGGLILTQCFFGFVYAQDLAERRGLRALHLEGLSADAYLERQLPEYALITRINHALPEDSLVYLLLTGDSFYYYQRRVVSEGNIRVDFLHSLLAFAGSAELLSGELLNRGITHILWNDLDTSSYLEPRLSPAAREQWRRFKQDHLEVIERSGKFILARISRSKLTQPAGSASAAEAAGALGWQ